MSVTRTVPEDSESVLVDGIRKRFSKAVTEVLLGGTTAE
jgi:hypothetical protein